MTTPVFHFKVDSCNKGHTADHINSFIIVVQDQFELLLALICSQHTTVSLVSSFTESVRKVGL